MSDYKISFVSVSLGRRISFAEYVGVKCDFMPLEMFMVACAIITKHPEDFPCLKVVSRSEIGREISSRILFKAPKV